MKKKKKTLFGLKLFLSRQLNGNSKITNNKITSYHKQPDWLFIRIGFVIKINQHISKCLYFSAIQRLDKMGNMKIHLVFMHKLLIYTTNSHSDRAAFVWPRSM